MFARLIRPCAASRKGERAARSSAINVMRIYIHTYHATVCVCVCINLTSSRRLIKNFRKSNSIRRDSARSRTRNALGRSVVRRDTRRARSRIDDAHTSTHSSHHRRRELSRLTQTQEHSATPRKCRGAQTTILCRIALLRSIIQRSRDAPHTRSGWPKTISTRKLNTHLHTVYYNNCISDSYIY